MLRRPSATSPRRSCRRTSAGCGAQVAGGARCRRPGDPRRRDGRPLRPADQLRAGRRCRRSPTPSTAPGAMIDVHLMIERPERQVEEFARAGADWITIHVEATLHVALRARPDPRGRLHARALRLCPATPIEALAEVAGRVARPRAVHERQPGLGRPGADPGLDRQARRGCAPPCPTRWRSRSTAGSTPRPRPGPSRAGANLLVTGSAVFGAEDPAAAYREIVAAVRDI